MSEFYKLMSKTTDGYYSKDANVVVFTGTQEVVESALRVIEEEMKKNNVRTTGFAKLYWSEPAEVQRTLPELSLYYAQCRFKIVSFLEAPSGGVKPEIEFDIKAEFQSAYGVKLVEEQPVELEKKHQREGKISLVSASEVKRLLLGKEVVVSAFGSTADTAINRAQDHAQFLVDSTIESLIKRNFIRPERQVAWFNEQREQLKIEYAGYAKSQAESTQLDNQVNTTVTQPKIKALHDTRSMMEILAEEQSNKQK